MFLDESGSIASKAKILWTNSALPLSASIAHCSHVRVMTPVTLRPRGGRDGAGRRRYQVWGESYCVLSCPDIGPCFCPHTSVPWSLLILRLPSIWKAIENLMVGVVSPTPLLGSKLYFLEGILSKSLKLDDSHLGTYKRRRLWSDRACPKVWGSMVLGEPSVRVIHPQFLLLGTVIHHHGRVLEEATQISKILM